MAFPALAAQHTRVLKTLFTTRLPRYRAQAPRLTCAAAKAPHCRRGPSGIAITSLAKDSP